MIDEIVDAWKENSKKAENQPKFKCQHCSKAFHRESTLMVHQCEPKRRADQENEIGVRYGFHAYLKFYEIKQGSSKSKTYKTFCESQFYTAFVKFGRHINAMNVVAPEKYIDWIVRSDYKLDKWCSDKYYSEFLSMYIRREHPSAGLERSIAHMQKWADDNDSVFNHYFLYAAPNKVCYDISVGKISPWLVFNCKSGQEFLDKVNEEQLLVIFDWINPDFWQQKFREALADTEWVKTVAEAAGL